MKVNTGGGLTNHSVIIVHHDRQTESARVSFKALEVQVCEAIWYAT